MQRRVFLASTVGGAATAATASAFAANDTVVVAVMGTGGRGTEHARHFAKLKNVKVAAVCDPDQARREKAAKEVAKTGAPAPTAVADFRRILDDKSIDALVVATCNHWHAPATILACAAGKHVYVEKPCSHNPREGELMVEAAAKHKRQVQMGNQRRTWPKVVEAVEFIRKGGLGRTYLAQCWYTANRPSIGKGTPSSPPKGLDYALWQGPAPARAFHSNYLHYNWHWFWHWGNGELGNNGVHFLDVCRWGLGVDFPTKVASTGGRYHFQDDQETPDVQWTTFEFPDRKAIAWHGLSCSQIANGKPADVVFTGEKGTLAIKDGGYTVYDPKGKVVRKETGPGGDEEHIENFLAGIRTGAKLNSPITEGRVSTLLCHLGNIAHRTGRVLHTYPENGRISDDADAMHHWSREYAKGWEPKV